MSSKLHLKRIAPRERYVAGEDSENGPFVLDTSMGYFGVIVSEHETRAEAESEARRLNAAVGA